MRHIAEIRDLLSQPDTLNTALIIELVDQAKAWREDARGLLAEVARLALREDQVIVPGALLRTLRAAVDVAVDPPARIRYAADQLAALLDDHAAALAYDEANPPERPHLIGGEFQSDKYRTTPRGKVPLSVRDPDAQPLLWRYAELHEKRDAEFSADLRTALINSGYKPSVDIRCTTCGKLVSGPSAAEAGERRDSESLCWCSSTDEEE